MFKFEIDARIPGKLGRAGTITTDHGQIKTPAFMCVGTYGQVHYVSMEDLREIGAQAVLSNGYHLRHKGPEMSARGGLASWNGWNGPTITDSGGFQVMSMGAGKGKVVSMEQSQLVDNYSNRTKRAIVTEEGIRFTDPFTDVEEMIGPKESMEYQCAIGADIHMAFDQLTSLGDTYEQNVEALERTERWAKQSLEEHNRHRFDLGYEQALYGVLQGGRWEDLRRATARTLGAMPFDGYGLGGAFLKSDLSNILAWCNEELPENKPRHLLGLSRPDDILAGVEQGADTFDCVAPTREGRHGRIYTKYGHYNLDKHGDEDIVLEPGCDCPACRQGYTRRQLKAMRKSTEEAERFEYFRLASLHNLRFTIRLAEGARQAILDGTFDEYKKKVLADWGSGKADQDRH